MKLRDKNSDQFTTKMRLGDDVYVHCHYKKGMKSKGGYVCYLMEVAVVIGLLTVSRHKCGGAELWIDERMTVE